MTYDLGKGCDSCGPTEFKGSVLFVTLFIFSVIYYKLYFLSLYIIYSWKLSKFRLNRDPNSHDFFVFILYHLIM